MSGPKKDESVSESILAAFDQHEAASDANAGTAPSPSEPAGVSASETGAAPAQAGEASTASPADAAASSADPQKPTTSQADGSKADGPIAPPVSWDAPSKAEFAKLPPELQKTIAKRESERETFVTQKSEEFAQQRKRFDDIDRVFEARRDAIARTGMTEAQVVNQLLALADQADRDFPGFIKEQAALRGIDLSTLTAAPAAAEYVDPALQAALDRVAHLEGVVGSGQRAAVAETQTKLTTTINEFKDQKDANGLPVRPHYAKVENDMVPLIVAIRQGNLSLSPDQVLQQAYDRAVWASPEIRADLIELERRKGADNLMTQERERAERAKGAAVSHRGSPTGSGAAPVGDESVEATLRAAMAQHGM